MNPKTTKAEKAKAKQKVSYEKRYIAKAKKETNIINDRLAEMRGSLEKATKIIESAAKAAAQ